MQKLPIELLKGIDSPSASIREIIAEELAQMLHSGDGPNRMVAYGALQKLCDDDSRRVSKIATESIAAFEENKPLLPPKTDPPKVIDTSKIQPKQTFPNTALRIYGLVGLLIALLGGGFFLLTTNSGSSETKDSDASSSLVLAKQEMLELKTSAKDLGAEVYAVETYMKAIKAEERGDQKSIAGDHLSAKISYDFAKGLFHKSLEETLENVDSNPSDTAEDNQLEIAALGAKSDMEKAKDEAKKSKADKVVKTGFKRALDASKKAESAYADGDFSVAASEYEVARNLFRKAGNEAQRIALVAETNLLKVRKIVEAAKQEMLMEKQKAEKGGGKVKVAELFDQAEQNEQSGDAKFKRARKKDYLAAQNYYSDAKEGYKQVNSKLAKMFFIPKLADDASLARTEMNNSKGKIQANQAEIDKLDVYQEASNTEEKGNQEFQAKKYKAAQTSFQQAERLYLQALNQLAQNKVKEKSSPSGGQVHTGEDLEDKNTRGQQEIHKLIGQYKKGLENGDVNQLLPFISRGEEKTWSNFFKTITDMEVSIQNENIQVDQDKAQVNFMVVMSYFNKSTNKTITNAIPKDWELSGIEGKWSLISQK